MASFYVNGQLVTAEKNQKLLRFLRDELRLTSVKDGCSEGACGTCHVLIDGKATKACVPSTDKLEGRRIITVEGLSDREKEVYTWAFGKAGAVQCGFCIPGMILTAEALLKKKGIDFDAEEMQILIELQRQYLHRAAVLHRQEIGVEIYVVLHVLDSGCEVCPGARYINGAAETDPAFLAEIIFPDEVV